jgi:hypothetical protein
MAVPGAAFRLPGVVFGKHWRHFRKAPEAFAGMEKWERGWRRRPNSRSAGDAACAWSFYISVVAFVASAPEGRQRIAHGASHGNSASRKEPGRAKEALHFS